MIVRDIVRERKGACRLERSRCGKWEVFWLAVLVASFGVVVVFLMEILRGVRVLALAHGLVLG
jgi:hypothetical protein